jgi:hypothetical protein
MPLPKLVAPTYELELPSTSQKIKYRPFLVKEEKILLLAMESEDEKQMINAVQTILKNCIQTKLKVEDLSIFDIEYLFLNIRAKSVGEEIELNITCPDDGETTVPVTINVEDIKVQKSDDHEKIIALNDSISITMKYPSMEMFVQNNLSGNVKTEDIFEIASSCIDQVVDGEEVYEVKSFSKKEINEFLDSLDTNQFMKIQKFFETMPKLSHTVNVTNPNTKKDNEVVIEGLASFFA